MASSVLSDEHQPDNAVEGTVHAQWSGDLCFRSADDDAAPWLMIDLQKRYSIQAVKLIGRTRGGGVSNSLRAKFEGSTVHRFMTVCRSQ